MTRMGLETEPDLHEAPWMEALNYLSTQEMSAHHELGPDEIRLANSLHGLNTPQTVTDAIDAYKDCSGFMIVKSDYNQSKKWSFSCERMPTVHSIFLTVQKKGTLQLKQHNLEHSDEIIGAFGYNFFDQDLQGCLVNKELESTAAVKETVREHCGKDAINIRLTSNKRTRVTIVCNTHIACPFRIEARTKADGLARVTKSCNFSHEGVDYVGNQRRESTQFLTNVVKQCADSTHQVKVIDVIKSAKSRTGRIVTYMNAYRALQRHQHLGQADVLSSFAKVRPLLSAMKAADPGTHVDCTVVNRFSANSNARGPPRFESAFFCYGIMEPIVSNCLPLIFLDACHTKGPGDGVICVASVVTGNNDTIVVAVSVNCCNECEMCWDRFFKNLLIALPILHTKNMVVVSDRDKGLRKVCADFVPHMPHSYCAQHIKRNVKSQTKRDLGSRVVQLAKAKRAIEAKRIWAEISAPSAEAAAYLRTIEDEKWISSAFPCRRYGIVTSNPVESSNAWLEPARHMDVFSMCTSISDLMMERLSRPRVKYEKIYDDRTLCPKAAEVVKRNVLQGRLRAVIPSANFVLKVSEGDGGSRVDDLQRRTCSCLKWDEYELPCVHVCAALHYRHSMGLFVSANDPTIYCSERYLNKTIQNMYAGFTFPTDISLLIPDDLMPATFVRKRSRGRKQKKRMLSAGE